MEPGTIYGAEISNGNFNIFKATIEAEKTQPVTPSQVTYSSVARRIPSTYRSPS